jgi:N-acetylmuramoyl-L-alanine amidase
MNFDVLYNEIIHDTQVDESRGLRALLAAGMLAGAPMSPSQSKEKPEIQQAQPSGYKLSQIHNIIARTLWAEARNDGEQGMRAVAAVIYNRARGDIQQFVDVIKKPKQFSCWNAMTAKDWLPENFKTKNKSDRDRQWKIAEKIANEMVQDRFTPVNNKIDHYYNPAIVSPSWGKDEKGEMIGSHKFMDLERKWDT